MHGNWIFLGATRWWDMVDRTIVTTGSGHREAEPERTEISLEAKGKGESPKEARQHATDAGATIQAALPGEYGQITGFHLDEYRHFQDEDERPYTATQTIEVTCPPSDAGEVVVAAADAGAAVTTVAFGLSEATREACHTEALDAAMEDARRKATAIASAEGLTVGAIREVSTTDTSGMPDLVNSALESGPDDSFAFEPTPITVAADVEVVYELTATE